MDRLGAGGMGVVYLATDPLLRRTVAIKVLPAHDEDLHERFQREARSAASLRHNNVVTIYDIGEDDGKPFIAMEFLDGESVAELVHRRAPLSIDRRLQLLLDLCAGLGYAHKNGIVHRDIKPGNLMVTAEGPLKILDFGLAKITSEAANTGLTRVGSVLGTPHYMSPEQVEGKVADARSDIFSVGVVFYELLTYQKAYPGSSSHVVLHNIIHATPTPIRELLPSIPPELEALVNKALEKDPEKRYQDLSSLAADAAGVRASMTAGAEFETMISPRRDSRAGSRSKSSKAGDTTPGRGTRHLASLDAIAQRRVAQVEAFLQVAEQHFAAERFLETIEACENAVLLDADDERALQLLAQAQGRLDDRQVDQCLAEARACLLSGDLSAANALIEQTLKLRSDSTEALELQRQVVAQRREREQAADRARSAQAAVERARRNCEDGAFEAALRAVTEALHHDAANQDALGLRQRATEAIEEARRQQERDEQARALVERAGKVLAEDPAAASLLQGSGAAHPLVDQALSEATARLDEQQREQQRVREREAIKAREQDEEETRLVNKSSIRRAMAKAAAPPPAQPADEDTVRMTKDAVAKMLAKGQVSQPQSEVEKKPELPREQRRAVAPPPVSGPPLSPSIAPPPVAPPPVESPAWAKAAATIANKLPAGVKPLWVVAAAGLILATGIVLWLSTRGRPATADADSAPAAVEPVPAPAGSYTDTVQNARQRYQALDIDGAVSLALSVPESAPERAQAMELLATMRNEAAARAVAERQNAQALPTFDDQMIQQGAAKLDEAAKLIQPTDTARVVALYEEAITLFRQAPAAGWPAERLVSEAQKEYAAKKRDAAIDFALQALKLAPDHAGAMELLESMKSAAATTVAAANRRARTAGMTEANSAAFRDARAKEAAARARRAPAETRAALGLYAAAAAAYGSASIDGPAPLPSAPVTPAPGSAAQVGAPRAEERPVPATPPGPGEIEKVVADAARMRNDVDAIKFLTEQQSRFPGNVAITTALGGRQQARDTRITELVQRARGANDERAVELLGSALAMNPARTDVRAERERRNFSIRRVQIEKSVRDALNRFKGAFEARSVAQFVNIATYRTALDIGQEFQAYRNIRMDIDDINIAVQQDGSATVQCTIRMVRQPEGGGNSLSERRPWQLKVVNVSGGGWRITEATPR